MVLQRRSTECAGTVQSRKQYFMCNRITLETNLVLKTIDPAAITLLPHPLYYLYRHRPAFSCSPT